MSTADLQRLIQRATPRVEDVRSPDRTDFVRKEHGHLTLREIVDALDALEFTEDSFLRRMRDVAADLQPEASVEPGAQTTLTAVHGLFEVVGGLRMLSPAWPAAQDPSASADEVASAMEDQDMGADDDERLQVAVEAKEKGAQAFKQCDYQGAVEQYSAAIKAAPESMENVHTLFSNRSAAHLKQGDALQALSDARRCIELAPQWPKGRFREGCCLRELGRYVDSIDAFESGQSLEPNNGDWVREVEKTARMYRVLPAVMARQLVFNLLPGILGAWCRSVPEAEAGPQGVLQLQVKAELSDMGMPKWQQLKDRKGAAKAQIRYAYMGRREYLSNLAVNLQEPPEDIAVADLEGRTISIPEISSFLSDADGTSQALVHIDVRGANGCMAAILCSLPCGEGVRRYVGGFKEPPAPKGDVKAVLQLQQNNGFPKCLPQLLGFQSFPGDLNFPVVDMARDV